MNKIKNMIIAWIILAVLFSTGMLLVTTTQTEINKNRGEMTNARVQNN